MIRSGSRRNIIIVGALLALLAATAFLWPYRDFFHPRMTELRDDFGIIALRPCIAPCGSSIGVMDGYQVKSLRLDDLIARAGTPDKVAAVFTGNAENFRVDFQFFYVRRGLSFHSTRIYRPPESPSITLQPDLIINWIDIWIARSEDKLVAEMSEPVTYPSAAGLQHGQTWSGYHTIDLIMPRY